jgi:hypothetical protein
VSSVLVRGAEPLIDLLYNFPIENISFIILTEMGQIVYLYSQYKVPWKTGKLQRSAWYEIADEFKHILHYDAPYADVVERGRRDIKYKNTPYIQPSIKIMIRLMSRRHVKNLLDETFKVLR